VTRFATRRLRTTMLGVLETMTFRPVHQIGKASNSPVASCNRTAARRSSPR
jgi:hypothetical protein